LGVTVAPRPQTAQERADDARRRERRARETARGKRDRGETLLACLFERSADAQAAVARLAEALVIDDQHRAAIAPTPLTASPRRELNGVAIGESPV
jgi:hypothetical protein